MRHRPSRTRTAARSWRATRKGSFPGLRRSCRQQPAHQGCPAERALGPGRRRADPARARFRPTESARACREKCLAESWESPGRNGWAGLRSKADDYVLQFGMGHATEAARAGRQRRQKRGKTSHYELSHKSRVLTRTLSVDLPSVILTLLSVPVRVARMKDPPNDAIASTA